MKRLIVAVALLAALPAWADETALPLLPGKLIGKVHTIAMPAGQSIAVMASRYGVHPVRILKPSSAALRHGISAGERLNVDTRRVQPRFYPQVSGIVVNIPEAHLYLVDHGKLVKDYPVGVSMGDWKAPLGTSRVVSMEKNPTWFVPDSIQKEMKDKGREVKTKVDPGPGNPLGTRWIGFANDRFGIHGTSVRTSIKHYASHGCVRMLREHLEDLYGRIKLGTPVRIYYQPVLLAVDGTHVWVSVYPDIYKLNVDLRAQLESLASEAGVADRIDWTKVRPLLTWRDGIVADVAKATVQASKPIPAKHPSASPSPVVPHASEAPATPATVAPSAVPASDGTAAPVSDPTPDAPL